MSGPKCAFNTAAALRRVFMPSNLGTSEFLHVTKIFVPALLASSLYQTRTASWSSPNPSRSGSYYGQENHRNKGPTTRRVLGDTVKRVNAKLARLPRDDEIREPYVHIIEGYEKNGPPILSNSQRTKDVLADLDLKTHSLQVIAVDLPESQEVKWPVCKIINKREEVERQKQEKEKKKASALKEKTLTLNWALAPHDLEHKLKTMQKFLAKGSRVQILLMRKQNGKAKATAKDAEELVDSIVEAAKEVKGTTEWKKRDGALLGTLKINFQGKLQEKMEDTAQEEMAQETEEEA